MARYVFKKKKRIVRKFGPINGLPANVKRTSRPGMHGKKREGKQSEFAKGLFNKNKLRACFGISERQFRKYFKRASKKTEATGEALLHNLEFRLDNLVYRLGLAPSLPAARQFVVHGHIQVAKRTSDENAEVIYQTVDRPGYEVKVKQRIRLAPKTAKKLPVVIEQSLANAQRVDYLQYDEKEIGGYFTKVPAETEIHAPVEMSKIIEFSARRL
jgi:small subunit ribosomal protein S4